MMRFTKYWKMLKMGLPMGAAKQACVRDGKDPSIMDLDPEKSLSSQKGGSDVTLSTNAGPPLKDDPEYAKVSLLFVHFLSSYSVIKLSSSVLENA